MNAGEEIRIPFTPMATVSSSTGHFDRSVQRQIQKLVRISTVNLAGNTTIASVKTSFNPRIV